MEDGRKKIWICLLTVVLAAVLIGVIYYYSAPQEQGNEGFLIREQWEETYVSDMILYIKGDRDTEVTKPDVTLGDILSMECADKTVLPKIKTLRIIKFTKPGQQRCVISILRVIERIHEEYPRLQIENMGETDIIVTYEDQRRLQRHGIS